MVSIMIHDEWSDVYCW